NKVEWSDMVYFYLSGLKLIEMEITKKTADDVLFNEKINNLYLQLKKNTTGEKFLDINDKIWTVFFPEGVSLLNPEKRPPKIAELQEKRKVNITHLNPTPIINPAFEILFTSNVLLTVPLNSMPVDNLKVNRLLKSKLTKIAQEEQLYWYDHPVPIGIESSKNEVIYGLSGLSKMLEYEKIRGNADENTTLNCVLSASVTHAGLHEIVKDYLHDELSRAKGIKHLNVYLFTEEDTTKLITDILLPIAQQYMDLKESGLELLNEIIGVDGEYGRHFSFLKAIAAFWQVFIDTKICATYKIDLDQVFTQKELVEQTGASAFEHFKTPLWGARGIDSTNNEIEFGMIAGAVVNEEDFDKSIYYPDILFPQGTDLNPDEIVHFSRLPQALSTEAEMTIQYNKNQFDHAISRIHVLGGMSGILVNALRKYKPFTPTFIGRAEDQAYLLSVLLSEQPYLRCLHKSGLIMRHDKKAFVGEVLEAAEIGKMIGDYTRILLYSYYAESLPFGLRKIKDQVDPFTGCFISHLPLAVIYLRFALKAASFFNSTEMNQQKQGLEFLENGSKRLYALINQLTDDPDSLRERFQQERVAWDLFYDILNIAEQKLKERDYFTKKIKEKALSLVAKCKI
ncbi:MAG: hypothetical protein KAS18_11180, partial [Calditrichia bacterium]|nr:hypothetical protein [Calditrichia bacterium]